MRLSPALCVCLLAGTAAISPGPLRASASTAAIASATTHAAPVTPSATDAHLAPITTDSATTHAAPVTSTATNAPVAPITTDSATSNAAPVVSGVSIPTSSQEGANVAFSVTAYDPEGVALTYQWEFGDGTTAATAAASHRYGKPGSYSARVTVTDAAGATAVRSATHTVANLPPVVDAFALDGGSLEGVELLAAWAGHDASGTLPEASIDWGDGRLEEADPLEPSLHRYADDGDYVVLLLLRDAQGAMSTAVIELTQDNVGPAVTSIDIDPPAPVAGEAVTLRVGASDPGGDADPLTFRYEFDDGSPAVEGLELTSVSHVWSEGGTRTVTVTVTDDEGAAIRQIVTVPVDVSAPVIAGIDAPEDADEAETVSFAVTVEGSADPFTYEWDFGDGSKAIKSTSASSVTHAYKDDGGYTVSIKVTDTAGQSAQAAIAVAVANQPAVIKSTPPTAATDGVQYKYQASAVDPAGSADPLTWSLRSAPSGMKVTTAGLVTWTPTLDQALEASASVVLTVTDDGGATANQLWTILLEPVDADADGMPDAWEKTVGLDPADPDDAAEDSDGDGRSNLEEFEAGTDPAKSNAPGAPPLISPADGTEVTSLKPTLSVGVAADTDGDVGQYEIELYADAALSEKVAQTTVTAGTSGASWKLTTPLKDNTAYWWRARAQDPYAAGPWAGAAGFFVNTVNESPTAPSISLPASGATVEAPAPELEVTNATDPDRDALSYTFELYPAGSSTELIATAVGIPQGEAVTRWKVTVKLEEDQGYRWRSRAVDEHGKTGAWSAWGDFTYSAENSVPTVPGLVAPIDGAEVVELQPTLELSPSEDAEDDPLSYEIELDTVETFDSAAKVQSGAVLEDDAGAIRWSPGAPLADNALWYLRARAVDGRGTSDWTTGAFFVNSVNDAPGTPTLQNPSDGMVVDGDTVTLSLVNAVDVDRDPLTYTYVVSDGAGSPIWTAPGKLEDAGGTTSVMVSVAAFGGAGEYTWTAYAVDDAGVAGPVPAANRFTIAGAPSGDDDATPTGDDDDATPTGDDGSSPPGCGCATAVKTPVDRAMTGGATNRPVTGPAAFLLLIVLTIALRRRASPVRSTS